MAIENLHLILFLENKHAGQRWANVQPMVCFQKNKFGHRSIAAAWKPSILPRALDNIKNITSFQY